MKNITIHPVFAALYKYAQRDVIYLRSRHSFTVGEWVAVSATSSQNVAITADETNEIPFFKKTLDSIRTATPINYESLSGNCVAVVRISNLNPVNDPFTIGIDKIIPLASMVPVPPKYRNSFPMELPAEIVVAILKQARQ